MLEMLDRLEKEEVQNSDSNSGNLLDIIICYLIRIVQKYKHFFESDFGSKSVLTCWVEICYVLDFFADEGEELSERLSGLNLGNIYQL